MSYESFYFFSDKIYRIGLGSLQKGCTGYPPQHCSPSFVQTDTLCTISLFCRGHLFQYTQSNPHFPPSFQQFQFFFLCLFPLTCESFVTHRSFFHRGTISSFPQFFWRLTGIIQIVYKFFSRTS